MFDIILIDDQMISIIYDKLKWRLSYESIDQSKEYKINNIFINIKSVVSNFILYSGTINKFKKCSRSTRLN